MTWSKCIYLKSGLVSVLFSLIQLLETGKSLIRVFFLTYVKYGCCFFTYIVTYNDGFYVAQHEQ